MDIYLFKFIWSIVCKFSLELNFIDNGLLSYTAFYGKKIDC